MSVVQKVILKTRDGVKIVGDFYVTDSKKGVLLIHMMPATRFSWCDFAPMLVGRGFNVLAVDLRGHGESNGGPNGYKSFSDSDHQKSILDAEAGLKFLEEKGIALENISLIGASIGANLALWNLEDHPEIKQAVLLSAGLNYRGIKTEPLVKKLKTDQRIFFISSKDDVRSGGNNAEMNRELYKLSSPRLDSKILIYKNAGHGTDMFGKESPDLDTEILNWLR